MTKPVRKAGRPEHEPTEHTRAQVKALAAMGATLFEISTVMRLSEPTLRKHYESEIAHGSIEANAKVAQSLYRMATNDKKPNVTACIFWLKARAGWRDRDLAFDDRDEPPGKKAIAREEAKTAAVGTPWEDVLGGPGASSLQ